MAYLAPAQLTQSGRPVLAQGEYEVIMLDKVDLEFPSPGGVPGQLASAYKGGYVVLTNRRLIWLQHTASPSGTTSAAASSGNVSLTPRAACLPVSGVYSWARKNQMGLTGTKVRVELQCWVDSAGNVVESGSGARFTPLLFRCRGESPDTLTTQLEALLQAVRSAPPRPHTQPTSSTQLPPPPQQPLQQQAQQQQQQQAGGSEAGAVVDLEVLQQMVEMGFPRWRSARSLLAVGGTDIQAALDHLLTYGDTPGSDEPFDLGAGRAPAPLPPTRPPPSALSFAGPPMAYPPQGYPPQAYPPQAYPPQAYPPSTYPPSPYPSNSAYPGMNPTAVGPLTAGLQGMNLRQQAPPPPPPIPWGAPPPQSQAMQTLNPNAFQVQGLGSTASSWGGGSSTHPYDAGSDWGSGAGSMGGASGVIAATNPLAAASAAGYGWGAGPPQGGRGTQDSMASSSGGGGVGGGGGGASTVGVSGLVRREAAKASEASKVLDSAFQDLRALMAVAADMVALAEKFRGVSAAQGGPSGQDADELLDADTHAQLISLGIASPVTREMAGGRYHVELCRQLTDWLLAGPLTKAGGLMPLTDVYCLLNRARGTELVSPDDLLAAVKLFGQVGAPVSLRTLSSGMLAVQGADFSDDRICQRIAVLVEGDAAASSASSAARPLGPAITASDVARALGCATTLASEHLSLAESRGVLCRDDGPEGLRYFRNFFKDPQIVAVRAA